MKVNIGKGIELDIDTSKLNESVMAHVVYIGLRNILMDSHAAITKESDGDNMQANAEAAAMKKLDAMYNGEIRVAGTREGDPVRAEAIRLGTADVTAAYRAKGIKPDPKKVRELVVANVGRWMEKAAARVAEAKALRSDASDLIG